jgi:predicted RNA binding protein YcfA (HicA-like mRNA interferase family)
MARRQRYTQKELIRRLSGAGWKRQAGGRHQVKMTKEGRRPVTIPEYRGETLPVGLSEAILKQAGIEDEG